jgi:hypothetical protein
MALTTDLSRSPYYDDYNVDKNFYRVLYRPGTAVQTRELNQMQTILQDQIDKFGRHVFTEGSVIEGCSFTFDNSYNYVKINDNYSNGYAFTISDFQDKYVYNNNGLQAIIINTVSGYIAQDPDLNTLYLKYINVGNFSNGVQQTVFANNETLIITANSNISNTTAVVGNVTVSSVANSVGQGYAFTTTSGVIFQKGFFVTVQPQTLIVSKYTNTPNNISIGFNSIENIITPEADTSLLDNAAGAPNYSAPGAHRLQLMPTLYTTVTNQSLSNAAFFSLVDFQAGLPVTIRNTPEYNVLGKQLAQRTYETNGNFVVSPFILSTEMMPQNDSLYQYYNNLVCSKGIGYVEGNRVEFINNTRNILRKGIDKEIISGQIVSANYGNYIYADELVGDFDTENITLVELHNVAKTAITSEAYLGIGYSNSTKIGTAYVKAVAYDSAQTGTPLALYKIYLFDIKMNSGQNFSNVRSIINHNSIVKAVADVKLTYNAGSSSYIAAIQYPSLNTLIYPLGQKAIDNLGFNNTQYVYRNRSSAQILNTGAMSVTLPSVTGSATESFTASGVLDTAEINSFIVIPTATVSSTNKAGTVSATSSSNVVTGSSTTFATDYNIGDHIKINSETHLITFIANNTYLTVNENFSSSPAANTHAKVFIAGLPIDYARSTRNVTISGSTASFFLNESLASTLQTYVYYDIARKNTVAIKKNITRNVYVKIDCSNNSANNTGPWSLGLPDVFQINSVYIGTNHTYSNSTSDVSVYFTLNNGQTDNYYDLSTLNVINTSTNLLDANSTILVNLDVFSYDLSQGVGFFTANSYPVNDTANTTQRLTSIYTQEIPLYTSTSTVYDLRDCVDFRPYMANTANVTQTYTLATINPSRTSSFSILSAGSYLPSPDTNWESDVQHYLSRKDLAIINTNGAFKIIQGAPSVSPRTPLEQPGTMTIGVVDIPPYPSLTNKQAKEVNRFDYAITTTIKQNRRYTMADIGKLATRIDNLEYYTSLNLLEQATSALLVKNSTTGLNRFKNGILVDPFAGFDIADTTEPSINISISNGEMRPKFNQRIETFELDQELSSGVIQAGQIAILDYNQVPYISQKYATKYRNCIDGNIYLWKSTINLNPSYQTSPDLTTNPDVVNNLDLSQNWINLKNAWGTQWGNWTTVASNSQTGPGSTTQTGSTTDKNGNIINSFNTKTVTTTTTQQTQLGNTLSLTDNTQTLNLGNFVQDVSISQYILSTKITFSSIGLKPNSRVYAYFNNIPVSEWCYPLSSSLVRGIGVNYGDPLIVDASGSIHGIFTIPPKTFQSTELVFMLCDVDNLVTGISSISTQASGTFYATNLSIAKGSSYLNTRVPVLNVQQVVNQQTLTNTTETNTNSDSIIIVPGPADGLYIPHRNTDVALPDPPKPPPPPPADTYIPPKPPGDYVAPHIIDQVVTVITLPAGDTYVPPGGDSGPGSNDCSPMDTNCDCSNVDEVDTSTDTDNGGE